jgi:putative sigma-54 modulation protein
VRTIVKGKNIDVPDRTRKYAERKMARLERFLDDRSDAVVELSVEKHRSASDSRIVEVTLVIDGEALRSRAAGPTHEAGIDEVVDKIERRAIDYREKPRSSRVRPQEEKDLLRKIADGTSDEVPERRVVKTKRFAIEPMFEEDAIGQMDELGHDFFVFVNAENERIAVLYRRNDGAYGLIEPVVGGHYTTSKPTGSKSKSKSKAASA